MKNFIYFVTAIACFFAPLLQATEVLVEAKAAYFTPTDSTFRQIYGGSGIYGLEVSAEVWGDLYGWVSGSYLFKEGNSIGLNTPTKISIVPIGVGLKYFWHLQSVDLYAAVGAMPTFVHTHDDSPYVIEELSKWGCGVIGKIGAIVDLPQSFFLDLFAEYSYVGISNHNSRDDTVTPTHANISGFTFGAGIGYRFGDRCCSR